MYASLSIALECPCLVYHIFVETKHNRGNQDFDPQLFNAVNPITGMVVYPKGNIEILRTCLIQDQGHRPRRDKVRVFSKKSRERLALVAKETDVEFKTFITLTYGVNFPHSGKRVKNHLHRFLGLMKKHFGKFDYLWFFEFQKRGAPHLHMMTTLCKPNQWERQTFASLWAIDVQGLEDWKYSRLKDRRRFMDCSNVIEFHLRPRQWEPLKSKEGAARYATKYALKMIQKVPPVWFQDTGRFWGHSRKVGEFKGVRVKATDDTVRKLVKEVCPRIQDAGVVPKYLFDCDF